MSAAGARSAAALAFAVALCLGTGALAARFEPGAWYAALEKPPGTPPDRMFPIVWTLLYAAMGVAAWRVWRVVGASAAAHGPFAVQLALNGAWSALFFGLHRPGLALAEIALLWLAIAVTLRRFADVDGVAAWLLAPYLLWVSFAAYLNAGIWWLAR